MFFSLMSTILNEKLDIHFDFMYIINQFEFIFQTEMYFDLDAFFFYGFDPVALSSKIAQDRLINGRDV